MDMFEAMRSATFLHKVSTLNPSIMSSYDVLKMATIQGSRTLRLEDQIGSLEVGKKADVILVDLNKAHLRPLHDVVNTLVYCANGGDVDTVIVDGNIVVKNGVIETVSEGDAIQEAESIIERYKI
jgi:5-methylthioadenosine/S-adenosylhomocysteine deaminase